jgi:hypothetical protein
LGYRGRGDGSCVILRSMISFNGAVASKVGAPAFWREKRRLTNRA